jgi:guanylate kinase
LSRLIIVSGPSGVGKSTVLKRLISDCDLPLVMSVSATTRAARDSEVDGVDYHFLTPAKFAAKREAGEFLECCEVFGRGDWYGTLKSTANASLAAGKWVVLEIDVEGATKIAEVYPDAITVFVGLNNLDEIEQRLRARGTEDETTIRGRLAVAKIEIARAVSYQHFVINDDVDRAANEICEILKRTKEASGATDA